MKKFQKEHVSKILGKLGSPDAQGVRLSVGMRVSEYRLHGYPKPL